MNIISTEGIAIEATDACALDELAELRKFVQARMLADYRVAHGIIVEIDRLIEQRKINFINATGDSAK